MGVFVGGPGLGCHTHREYRRGQKPTLIRIERMKRVLDADKRCDSEGLQLSSLRTVLFPPFVLSFWVTDLTRTDAGFCVVLCVCFYFGWVVHKILEIFETLELNNYVFNHF